MTWKPVFAAALVLATVCYGPLIVAGYFSEEILAALGGQDVVLVRIETFLLGLSAVGLVALLVALLGVLTVFHYSLVKPGLTTLVVPIYLSRTRDRRPDEAWEDRLREHSPEFRAFERRAEGDGDAPERTGTWRDLFLP
jgi:uncharacterized protein HemY